MNEDVRQLPAPSVGESLVGVCPPALQIIIQSAFSFPKAGRRKWASYSRHLFVGEDGVDGDAVEVGRPQIVVRLYGDGVPGTFVQGDGNHLPAHAVRVPGAGAVAVALEEDGVAHLLAVDEKLGRSPVLCDVVDGQDVVAGVSGLDAVELNLGSSRK